MRRGGYWLVAMARALLSVSAGAVAKGCCDAEIFLICSVPRLPRSSVRVCRLPRAPPPYPFGLSPSKPGSRTTARFARHLPFGLRYRSLVLPLRGGCSLREAASGYAPDRAVTFFRFPERKSPKKGGPDGGGRPRADGSAVLGVWGLAQNSLRALWALRSNSRAKSVDEARLRARPQTPALLDASHGAQEQYGRCFATFPVHTSLRIGRNGDAQQAEGWGTLNRCAVVRGATVATSRGRKPPKRYSKVESVFALVTFI